MATFSFFSSVFGFIVAAISLLTFFVNIFRSHLPSNKIKVLESLLEETETCFKKAVEEGLLTELAFVQRTQRRLTILRLRTDSLRSRAYNATTLCKDYIELLSGTSSYIGRTCGSLRKLKGEVITSSEGRRSLMDIDFTSRCSSSPPTVSFRFEPEHRPIPRPPVVIPRPRSCPAALMEIYLDSEQPWVSCNSTLSDSDVGIADVQNCTSTIHTSVTADSEC
ncbi:hypothetical protein OG21DRAFT_1507591 [Imleria badia]|nr:hypothetical protein OG21DRAFT_1507591 [Imleria badia]